MAPMMNVRTTKWVFISLLAASSFLFCITRVGFRMSTTYSITMPVDTKSVPLGDVFRSEETLADLERISHNIRQSKNSDQFIEGALHSDGHLPQLSRVHSQVLAQSEQTQPESDTINQKEPPVLSTLGESNTKVENSLNVNELEKMLPPVFNNNDIFEDKNNVNPEYLIPIQQKPVADEKTANTDNAIDKQNEQPILSSLKGSSTKVEGPVTANELEVIIPPVFNNDAIYEDKNKVNPEYLIPIQQKPAAVENFKSPEDSKSTSPDVGLTKNSRETVVMFPPVFNKEDVYNEKNNVNPFYLIPVEQRPNTTGYNGSTSYSNGMSPDFDSTDMDMRSRYSWESSNAAVDTADDDADHPSWIDEEEDDRDGDHDEIDEETLDELVNEDIVESKSNMSNSNTSLITQPRRPSVKLSMKEFIRQQIILRNKRKELSKAKVPTDVQNSLVPDVLLEPRSNTTHIVSEKEFEQLRLDGLMTRNISSALFNLAPEVFMKTPQKFSRYTKSPCWWVEDPGSPPKMRCLPAFYLIGMPKCGTTDLYSKIIKHPSVSKVQKEPHWWTRSRFGRGGQGRRAHGAISYDAYLDHLRPLWKDMTEENGYKRFIAGDGSASTMWYFSHYEELVKDANHPDLPDILREIYRDVKIVVMLRNPVERLYSDYMYFHRGHLSPDQFHSLASAALAAYQQCITKRNPRVCISTHTSSKNARLTLGLYSVLLVDWMKVFPRDQMFVMRLRDWNVDCEVLLPKLYAFLEIERLSRGAIRQICDVGARNVNRKNKIPMLNKTAEMLNDFYQPYNQDLAALLGDQRFLWLD